MALFLLAVALAIPFLAGYEKYSLYRDGERVSAEVFLLEVHGDEIAAWVTYREHGEERGLRVSTSRAALKSDNTIDLLLHANTGVPLVAHELDEQFPSIWYVLASLVSLMLAVLVFRIPRRAAARRARRASAFEAIVDAAARTRNLSIGVGAMSIVFAAGFGALPFFDRTSVAATAFIEVLAAISLAIGVMSLRRGYRLRDPRHNELLGLIEQRPHEIAWIYVQEIEVQGGGKTLAIHLWKTDGKLMLLSMVAEDIDVVMGELSRRAPHAQVGYSRELEKLYRERPSRWAPLAIAMLVLVTVAGGCRKDVKAQYEKEFKPRIQTTLTSHAAKLAPLVPQLDAALDTGPGRCSAPQPDGKLVVLPRELAERLVKGELKAMSLAHRGAPLMTGYLHSALLGDTLTWSPAVFESSMKNVDAATLTGIYLTGKLDTGKVSGRSIARPGYFEGSFVLFDLARKQVLVRVPIKAATGDMVMIHNDDDADAQLAESLEYNVYQATTVALEAAGCGKLEPYTFYY